MCCWLQVIFVLNEKTKLLKYWSKFLIYRSKLFLYKKTTLYRFTLHVLMFHIHTVSELITYCSDIRWRLGLGTFCLHENTTPVSYRNCWTDSSHTSLLDISLYFSSFRPKSKNLFHAPPLNAVDIAEAREHMIAGGEDGDISPTFNRRDESPSGSFHVLDTFERTKPPSSSSKENSEESEGTRQPLIRVRNSS